MSLAIPGYKTDLPYTNGGGESLCEVLDALEQFNSTCNGLFGNIQDRLSVERERYESLSTRISDCAERVDALKGRREAIVVVSTPKFPTPKDEVTNQKLIQLTDHKRHAFKKKRAKAVKPITIVKDEDEDMDDEDEDEDGDGGRKGNPMTNHIVRLDGRADDVRPLRPVDPTELFEFNLLMPQEASKRYTTTAERGLGRLPRRLPYVSGLLLFNTRENPYKEYSDVNLFSQNRAERVIAGKVALHKPGNIHDGDFLKKKDGENVDFIPFEADAPNMQEDLSDDLPIDDIVNHPDWCSQDFKEAEAVNPSAVNKRRQRRGSGDSSMIPSVSEMAAIRPSKPTKPTFEPATLNTIPASSMIPALPQPSPRPEEVVPTSKPTTIPALSQIPLPPNVTVPKQPPQPPTTSGIPPPTGGPKGVIPHPPTTVGGLPAPTGRPNGANLPVPPLPSKLPVPPPNLPAPTQQPPRGHGDLMEEIRRIKKEKFLKQPEKVVKKEAVSAFRQRLALLREGVQGGSEFSEDEDEQPAKSAVQTSAATTAPTPTAKKVVPAPPLPLQTAPGGKLGGKREFKEEVSDDEDWE